MTAGMEPFGLVVPTLAKGAPANVCLVDLDADWEVGEAGYESRSANCAFAGRRLTGRVRMTIAAGAVALPRALVRDRGCSVSAAYLLLEDGTRFDGDAVGAPLAATGEVVFNTAMSGYQESVTDPSYRGQMIVFTYPLIGNYGVCAEAMESDSRPRPGGRDARGHRPRGRPARRGRLARPGCADCGVPAISGVDTRALVRHIRDRARCAAASSPASCRSPRRAS